MFFLFTRNDLDGVGCGILAKLAFKDDAAVRYNSVSGLDLQVAKFLEKNQDGIGDDDFLCITDLSVGEDIALKLTGFNDAGSNVKLIDHHKSAIHLNEYKWGSITVAYQDGRLTSATSLLYDYLIENQHLDSSPVLEEFVELVRQYDTWEWDANNNEKAKQLNDLFYLLSIDEFENRMVERIRTENRFDFDHFEKEILKMEKDKIDRYVVRKERELVQGIIGGYCVGVVHAESYHSELGNVLGKENPHIDYIAILNLGNKKISLRTIHDNVDVSEVARTFGGGGHAKASGCPLTEEAFRLFVTELFNQQPIKLDATRNIYNVKGVEQGSYYENRAGDQLYIYLTKGIWAVEKNGKDYGCSFDSFQLAEREIKRKFQAGLAKDEHFVKYLTDFYHKSLRR